MKSYLSLNKLQLWRPEVTYLGHTFRWRQKATKQRKEAIQNAPQPFTYFLTLSEPELWPWLPVFLLPPKVGVKLPWHVLCSPYYQSKKKEKEKKKGPWLWTQYSLHNSAVWNVMRQYNSLTVNQQYRIIQTYLINLMIFTFF